MKTLSKILLGITSIGLFSIAACKKEDTDDSKLNNNNTNALNCNIETAKLNDTLINGYEYNTNGKLSKLYEYGKHGILRATRKFQYSDSTITESVTKTDSSGDYTETYYLGKNGYAYKSITENGGFTSTTTYMQDANGYLIKFSGGTHIETNTIENGNTVKTLAIDTNSVGLENDTTTITYEYYFDKPLPNAASATVTNSILGKQGKNLVKKQTTIDKYGIDIIEFSYEIENGLLTTASQKYNGGKPLTATYTYKCK